MTATHERPVATPLLPRDPTRRRRAVVAVAVLLALAGLATWLVAFSSVLGVHHVRVRGTASVPPTTVERVADVPQGHPLVRLDTSAIARRVETIPAVAGAEVTTSWPSTVIITVRERIAVGVLREDGQLMLVDRTGALYKKVATRPARLPLLAVSGGRAARAAAARVAAAMPADLRHRVRSLQALDPTAITVVLRSGTLVRWGGAERSMLKARVVEALRHRSVDQIDVTDPYRPYTR